MTMRLPKKNQQLLDAYLEKQPEGTECIYDNISVTCISENSRIIIDLNNYDQLINANNIKVIYNHCPIILGKQQVQVGISQTTIDKQKTMSLYVIVHNNNNLKVPLEQLINSSSVNEAVLHLLNVNQSTILLGVTLIPRTNAKTTLELIEANALNKTVAQAYGLIDEDGLESLTTPLQPDAQENYLLYQLLNNLSDCEKHHISQLHSIARMKRTANNQQHDLTLQCWLSKSIKKSALHKLLTHQPEYMPNRLVQYLTKRNHEELINKLPLISYDFLVPLLGKDIAHTLINLIKDIVNEVDPTLEYLLP